MRKSEKKQKYKIMKGFYGKSHRFKEQLLLFAAMVMFMALPFTTKAQNGSASAPFPIRTAQQLTSLAQRINAGGTFYFNPADSLYYASNGSGYISIPNGGESRNFKLVADINLNAGDMASCDGVLPSGATAWIVLGNSEFPGKKALVNFFAKNFLDFFELLLFYICFKLFYKSMFLPAAALPAQKHNDSAGGFICTNSKPEAYKTKSALQTKNIASQNHKEPV